jgi:hypothetical protein
VKAIAAALFFAHVAAADLSRVVADDDFVFHVAHSGNVWALLRSYSGNRMTSAQVEWLVENCRSNNIGVLWALARMQTEQGVVVNRDSWNYEQRIERCMSYGFGTHSNEFRGYSNQVRWALRRMRELADEWRPGARAPVKDHGKVVCANLATYGLHRYNWVWGMASNHGAFNVGNALFVMVLREMQARYERVTRKN